jgi:CRP/FNR family transcriptional regulator, anaerobic regulatory protein
MTAAARRGRVRAGQRCAGFALVLEGSIRVSKSRPEGRGSVLYRAGPGESCIFTSSCVLGATEYSAHAWTETPVRLRVLPRGDFMALVAGLAPVREQIFRLFGERAGELMSLVDAVAFQRLDQRLATRLLGHGRSLEISHQGLASVLGSLREIVSRLLGEFEARGALVQRSRGYIEIADAAGLRDVAGRGL